MQADLLISSILLNLAVSLSNSVINIDYDGKDRPRS